MQDRYAGDLGDFLKFGLVRWLVPPDSPWPRLGVIWYRTADEAHNADGKHIAYLTPGHRSAGRLRQLDPDLYERLARVVSSGQRSTAALASAGVPARRHVSLATCSTWLTSRRARGRPAARGGGPGRGGHWPRHRAVT